MSFGICIGIECLSFSNLFQTLHKLMLLQAFICFLLVKYASSATEDEFTFNGFSKENLTLDEFAQITSNGLLQLTNWTLEMQGHAFYPSNFSLKDPQHGNISSFSTTFVFAILSEHPQLSGHGLAFVISPTKNFSTALANQYLGLFNQNNNGNFTNHVLAVELDTIINTEFNDINGNHVGIDINSLISNKSQPAGYYTHGNSFNNLTLTSGESMQVWVDYDSRKMELNVTLAPLNIQKPVKPLLSATIDLSTVLQDSVYVGFSSSTGAFLSSHYVLGWSFKINGEAQALNYSLLPTLPRARPKGWSKIQYIVLPFSSAAALLLLVAVVAYLVRRKMKYAEIREDWELQYGPQRFSYKDLFSATNGFKEKRLLGSGGFGSVYKGQLSSSKMDVAVKRVCHESRQGMKEFIAEIASIGRLRHRNLVQLLGYCRRKGELLLVYDYMPNGILDKFLYDQSIPLLDWFSRFRIIKGVASGLLYLHEDWEKVVIHRDIKASNVLLDNEMNARLGDFGLARLYDHGTDPHTTHLVGTMGYLAPELARKGKATKATDVFAFGAFILEVACGKRPLEANSQMMLVDWVLEHWQKGAILQTRDPRLGEFYVAEEMELILKLGLLCSHNMPAARPTMRQVLQYLDGDMPLPELSPKYQSFNLLSLVDKGFDDCAVSYTSSGSSGSLLSGGR